MNKRISLLVSVISLFSCTKETEPISSDCFGFVYSETKVDSVIGPSLVSLNTDVFYDVYFSISEPCEEFVAFNVTRSGLEMEGEVKTNKDKCDVCDVRNAQAKEVLALNFKTKGFVMLTFYASEQASKRIIVQ